MMSYGNDSVISNPRGIIRFHNKKEATKKELNWKSYRRKDYYYLNDDCSSPCILM